MRKTICLFGLFALLGGSEPILGSTLTPVIDSVFTAPGVSQELAQFRKAQYGPITYELFFDLPRQKQEAVTGCVTALFEVAEQVPLIFDFRADSTQLLSVALNGEPVTYSFADEHMLIPASEVKPGTQQVTLAFIAADQSLNRRDDYLYTLLVPDRARTLFPCFDQPDMKANYRLTLELPADWEAVANSPVQHISRETSPGRNRITFAETEPLSTYLFSFVGGRLEQETFERDGHRIGIYHRETDSLKRAQCSAIADEVIDALVWLEDYTGIRYPFAKYDLIILPGFQFGGMEHTGATLYNDTRMFLNPQPTLNEQLGRSALIAHETAHMWFGDLVTMAWFDDVWTKEVFANYFASRIVEPLYPEINHRLNVMLDYLPGSYAEDRTSGSNAIKQELDNMRNAGLIYGNIIYNKSPVVMEMLVQQLGETAFRQGIQRYLSDYAYDNATWEGLVSILDELTPDDMKRWSDVWINAKGMPEIRAEVQNGQIRFTQTDPFGRALSWPQTLTYGLWQESGNPANATNQFRSEANNLSLATDPLITETTNFISGANGFLTDTFTITLNQTEQRFDLPASVNPETPFLLIPNIDGRGYGYFRINAREADALLALLPQTNDDVLKGSLLITLYENLLHGNLASADYIPALLRYLETEQNPLLYSLALGQVASAQRLYPVAIEVVEPAMWQLFESAQNPELRLQTFRTYRSLAESAPALETLYAIWETREAPEGCSLSENDYIALSYQLALRMPERAETIVNQQLARITNPDRMAQYQFIAPSVSADPTVRDSLFAALLIAENRRIEPWAASALANLNAHSRQDEAVHYILPGLQKLQEIQRTGDIFFPRSWSRALLSGHTSEAARRQVELFFEANPDYPVLLRNKINQQADHLFRK